MNKDDAARPGIPASAAEAWAAVYIDVAEKLDAEEAATSVKPKADAAEDADSGGDAP